MHLVGIDGYSGRIQGVNDRARSRNAEQWHSKLGFILGPSGPRSVGSIWRFRIRRRENGGAAFLIVYMAMILRSVFRWSSRSWRSATGRSGCCDAFEWATPTANGACSAV